MAHMIEKPIDKVLSIQGKEWHGLADHVPAITDTEVSPLLFTIREGRITVNMGDMDGKQPGEKGYSPVMVEMDNQKAVVADFTDSRPDLIGTPFQYRALHVPRDSYKVLDNAHMWECVKKAVADVDGKVTTAGTLEGGKKFFVSVALGSGDSFRVGNDEFRGVLNMITSHDGTLAAQMYDSSIRIVCMNTLRASMGAAGNLAAKVYHSAGADIAIANMAQVVNNALSGRAQFVAACESLLDSELEGGVEGARVITAGYFAMVQGVHETAKDGFATRTRNAIDAIALLSVVGKGNKGQSLYDVLNGATEYWTHGDGTGKGKKTELAARVYKANFGGAADHKTAFLDYLLDPKRGELVEVGTKALAVVPA